MRPRFLLAAVLILLAVALAAVALAPRGRHAPRPPAGAEAMPRPLDLGPSGDAPLAGWAEEVMPMHRAVRLASRRFHGKVLDIALVAGRPGAEAYPLVYRIRMLTRGGDVLDIRMDAFTGRFLELRGADLAAARRRGHAED